MSGFVLKKSECLNVKFDVVKVLFCWNQRSRIDSSFHLLICLVFKFFERCVFERLTLVRSQSNCLTNLKRKTCLIDSLFLFSLKVCEGLLFSSKKEIFLLRIIHIDCWRTNYWTSD